MIFKVYSFLPFFKKKNLFLCVSVWHYIRCDHKVEQLNQKLVQRGGGWGRRWGSGGGAAGRMSVECGREKHFDKGLMKKSMEWECQQTERGSQKPPETELGCWSSLSFSRTAGSFLYASLAAWPRRVMMLQWAEQTSGFREKREERKLGESRHMEQDRSSKCLDVPKWVRNS